MKAGLVHEFGEAAFFPEIESQSEECYGRGKFFRILASNVSHNNKYMPGASVNGKEFTNFRITVLEVFKGGTLELNMGLLSDKNWGITDPPPSMSNE